MSNKVIITGRAAALIHKNTGFDPADPQKTPAHKFIMVDEENVQDGQLKGFWGSDYRWVGFAEIKVEINPMAEMLDAHVKALQAQKVKLLADTQLEVNRIDGELQRLLAIELKP